MANNRFALILALSLSLFSSAYTSSACAQAGTFSVTVADGGCEQVGPNWFIFFDVWWSTGAGDNLQLVCRYYNSTTGLWPLLMVKPIPQNSQNLEESCRGVVHSPASVNGLFYVRAQILQRGINVLASSEGEVPCMELARPPPPVVIE